MHTGGMWMRNRNSIVTGRRVEPLLVSQTTLMNLGAFPMQRIVKTPGFIL